MNTSIFQLSLPKSWAITLYSSSWCPLLKLKKTVRSDKDVCIKFAMPAKTILVKD